MPSTRTHPAFATALLSLFLTRTALADATDAAAAEALFRGGRMRVEAADYAGACPLFQESLRLDPAPGTLLNLADCEEHTGRLASAWEHFARLERGLPETDERYGAARERRARLAPRVPHLTIRLAYDVPDDALVFRDDVEVGRASMGLALPVDPGLHVVRVVAPGHVERRTDVNVTEGHAVEVVASPGAPLTSTKRTAGWIFVATGVASLATGTYFGVNALERRSASDARCSGSVCADAAGLDDYSAARNEARVADVAFGIGVAAVVVGGYLLLSTRSVEALGRTGSAPGNALGLAW